MKKYKNAHKTYLNILWFLEALYDVVTWAEFLKTFVLKGEKNLFFFDGRNVTSNFMQQSKLQDVGIFLQYFSLFVKKKLDYNLLKNSKIPLVAEIETLRMLK